MPVNHTAKSELSQRDLHDDFEDLLGPNPNVVPLLASNESVALELAKRGFVVFPIRQWGDEDGWKPIAGFPTKASKDAAQIRAWWKKWPEARVGLLAGARNGLTVLDVDVKNGKDGTESLKNMGLSDLAAITPFRVRTPSGGWHLLFEYTPNVKSTVGKIGEGLDVRNDNTFIIAPYSLKDDKRYEVKGDHIYRHSKFPAIPAAIMSRAPLRDDDEEDLLGTLVTIQKASPWQMEWAAEKLDSQAEIVASAPDGQRQATLNSAVLLCAGLAVHGALTEEQVRAALMPAGAACGLSQREVSTTFKHAWADGLKKPVQLPVDCEDEFEDYGDEETAKAPSVVSDEAGGWHIDAFSVSQEPDLSQDQLALDLGKAGLNKNGRYLAEMGGWILWDPIGQRWAVASGMQHMRIARDFVRAKARLLTEWAEAKAVDLKPKDAEQFVRAAKAQSKAMKQDAAIAAVERLARSNKASLSTIDQWDADDFLLGTPAGTVDLRTGELRPAKRSDYITKQTAVAPEDATPHTWLKFLSDVFPNDPEMVTFIQRLLGYSLTGSTKEQKFFMFLGTGRNGKGTLLNTFQNIIGDYAKGIPTTTLLESRNPQHAQSLARLQGARFVRGAELPVGQVWNESLVKTMTGGDVITANHMRQNSFDFVPKFTLIVDGNTKPRIRTTDAAMKARMTLVPFDASFIGREDRSLPDRLQAEAGAILRWCIEGAVAWQKDGLRIPETVAKASREYLEGEDRLSGFIAEEVERDSAGVVPFKRLYVLYCQWCEEERESPMTKRSFSEGLIERGFQKKNGTGNVAQIVGLKLKSEDDLGAGA